MLKKKDPDSDPNEIISDPDLRDPNCYRSFGSGTLVTRRNLRRGCAPRGCVPRVLVLTGRMPSGCTGTRKREGCVPIRNLPNGCAPRRSEPSGTSVVD